MLKNFIITSILLTTSLVNAQEIPIGTWQDHLSYNKARSVAYNKKEDIAYCGTSTSLFSYDNNTQEVTRYSTINGLNSIGIGFLGFSEISQNLVIGYVDGNIDILANNGKITNIPFIKNSDIFGSKTINHINIDGEKAYLSCGFGIVVLNTSSLEIEDTYRFGTLGANIPTNATALFQNHLYAATDIGVYYAPLNAPNIADYSVWKNVSELGQADFSDIAAFNNQLFVCKDQIAFKTDTIFFFDGGWKTYESEVDVYNIQTTENILSISYFDYIDFLNPDLTLKQRIYTYTDKYKPFAKHALFNGKDTYWIADENLGLIKSINNWNHEEIIPNGPSGEHNYQLKSINEEIWVASGPFGSLTYSFDGIYQRKEHEWSSFDKSNNSQFATFYNACAIAVNPIDNSEIYTGSFGEGLARVYNDKITNVYTTSNSTLPSSLLGTTISSLTYDEKGNLWIGSSYSSSQLSLLENGKNTFTNFTLASSTNRILIDLLIDQNNNKWVLFDKANEIVIFNENETPNNILDDKKRVLKKGETLGNLPGTSTKCIAEDLNGEIWVGTDAGIVVFFNSSDMSEINDGQQIFIQQDGITQILLETEQINDITIDGANRKWIATQNSGVFLMSENGTQEIQHFTEKNSPLFSNTVTSIAITPNNGEVFFGTSKGIISYKGTATAARENIEDIYVYPNPVKKDFNGTIAIRGLVNNTSVKITDLSGNIVTTTTSLGGQAIWNGRNFQGEKVATGIYLVFCTNNNGEEKMATKILFVN